MVVAAREGGDPIADALRRLGRVRIATKYPRVAADHFAGTGRQAEIVEVKGSVELAPLTGLVDGIVDLTATGRTLEENHLRVVEEIGVCTARLIANPVSHKLKAAADRPARRADPGMRISRARNAWRRPEAEPGVALEVAAIIAEVRGGRRRRRGRASPSASTRRSSARAA